MIERHTEAPDASPTTAQQLFVRHVNTIRGFIIGLALDPDATDDILQEVFLTITAKAGEFQAGTNFLGWARTIVRLKTLEHWRAQRRTPQPFSPDVFEALATSAPTDEVELAERQSAVRHCIEKLGEKARRIIELRYSQSMTSRQIAESISWKVDTVDVALSKARRFLRDCARGRLQVEGGAA